ncbi:MAG: hypothetical protein F4227_08035 [Gammaproteobacteria bacterium]|nr:hypothetical protein [Gammaproteobacteria bacterium]MYF02900.1 hypothetical protein [Gammaproteobacteria bacterium]MYI77033.1 hypothetical protein [Gammaproteobacteria bacterium]
MGFIDSSVAEKHAIVNLSQLTPFAIGGTRLCFVHPDDSNKCIKVLREDRTPQTRRQLTKGIKKLRPVKHWDDQQKELTAYRQLLARNTQVLWHHIPEFFGSVETDLGLGIVTRIFRNFDGKFPKNLEEEVPHGIDDSLKNGIADFKAWLRQELVVTRDLLPHNIIVVRDSMQHCRLMIVDGLGNSEWIPVSTWFRFFARRKIERKIFKFNHRVESLRVKR